MVHGREETTPLFSEDGHPTAMLNFLFLSLKPAISICGKRKPFFCPFLSPSPVIRDLFLRLRLTDSLSLSTSFSLSGGFFISKAKGRLPSTACKPVQYFSTNCNFLYRNTEESLYNFSNFKSKHRHRTTMVKS